jgi:hypothetical protein
MHTESQPGYTKHSHVQLPSQQTLCWLKDITRDLLLVAVSLLPREGFHWGAQEQISALLFRFG